MLLFVTMGSMEVGSLINGWKWRWNETTFMVYGAYRCERTDCCMFFWCRDYFLVQRLSSLVYRFILSGVQIHIFVIVGFAY